MGRTQKELYKNGTFHVRFRDLCYKSGKTQDDLATLFGVSRPTVAGWLIGKGTPNIHALTKIAQHFGVSTDYLLGLSDTVKPNATLRAAVEYTGLTEKAVEWLHIGLDDFECDGVGLSEEMKQTNLRTASTLILSKAFREIIHNLNRVAEEAYLEKILTILEEHYFECDSPEEDSEFHFARKEDRNVVEANLIHVLKTKGTFWDESTTPNKVRSMDDDALACDVIRALLSAQEANELRQFHAAKAFTGYIDQLVKRSYKKAERRFNVNDNTHSNYIPEK